MIFKHSFSITVSKFSLAYKILLFALIVILIFSAISISSIYFILEPIFQRVDEMDFFVHIGNAFKSIFTGNSDEAFQIVGQDFEVVMQVFAENRHNVIGAACALVSFLFIGKFLLSICYYPASDIINNFMNSKSKFGFTSNMLVNLKKAVAYSFVDTLISIPYMLLTGVIIYFVGYGIGQLSIIFAISACICLFMVLVAIKSSVFAMWLPTYINEDLGVFKSLAKSMKENKDLIVKNWGYYTMLNFISYFLGILFALVTFGLGLLLVVGIFVVFYLTSQLVIYYRKNEAKYYIDCETVINSKNPIKSVY